PVSRFALGPLGRRARAARSRVPRRRLEPTPRVPRTRMTGGMRMRRRTWIAVALCATAALALAVVGVTSAALSTKGGGAKGKPILIGAAVDLTKNMAPFGAPALAAAQIEIKKINAAGELAFSFGNAAQDEGAGVAEYAISKGWKNATVVTDNLLRYFQDVCKAFTVRFTQLGGKVLAQESFKQGDKTIGNIVSRVNSQNPKPQVIAFCTSFAGDQPAFVSGLRSLGN